MNPDELIHLADDLGNSVILRIVGRADTALTGAIEVGSYFVSGSAKTDIYPEDLDAWEKVLDGLAEGADGAAWREGQHVTELHLEPDDCDRLVVSVVDAQSFLVAVELTIEVPEDWIEDHKARLVAIRKNYSL